MSRRPGHIGKHDLVRTDDCVSCHKGTNLTSITLSTGESAAKHGGCSTCHAPSATSKVPAAILAEAIGDGHTECAFCHADPGHIAKHDLLIPSRGDYCVSCHPGTNLTLVHDPSRVSCVTCHSSKDAAVVAAITGGIKTCDACHADAHQASHQWCNDCHSNLPAITGDYGHNATSLIPNQDCANCHGTPFASLSGIGTSHAFCENPECHDGGSLGTPSPELHAVTRGDSCVTCHPGTNLTTIPSPTVAGAFAHASCATCHAPTSSTITSTTINAAIASGHATCSDCHGTGHDLPALHAASPASQTIISVGGTNYGTHACIECHTVLDLRTIHGGDNSCATCHTTSVKTTLGATWLKGCVQGGCHAAGTPLEMHKSIDTSHTTPATAQTSCGTQGTAACHGTLPTSVAALHASYGGCADCHNNPQGHPASLVCSTCHAAHGSLTALHAATLTSANFTFGGRNFGTIACSTCHASADLQTVHASAGACGACHPGIKAALGGTWTWDKTCTQGTCHSATALHPYHSTINNHSATVVGCSDKAACHQTNVAYVHSRVGCGVCHAPGHGPLTTNCATCHGAGGTATRVDSAASHMPVHDYCNYCHLVTPAYNEHGGNPGVPIDTTWNCTQCHTTPGVSPRLVGLYDHGCGNTVYSCH